MAEKSVRPRSSDIIKILALVFLAASLLALIGAASADDTCISPERWQSDVGEGNPTLSVTALVNLSGYKGLAAVTRFNAVPPATEIVADQVVILRGQLKATGTPMSHVMFGLFSKGCLVKFAEVDGRAALKLIEEPGDGV